MSSEGVEQLIQTFTDLPELEVTGWWDQTGPLYPDSNDYDPVKVRLATLPVGRTWDQ